MENKNSSSQLTPAIALCLFNFISRCLASRIFSRYVSLSNMAVTRFFSFFGCVQNPSDNSRMVQTPLCDPVAIRDPCS